ncbi:hif1an [Symbiodinium sp. KB8]|nr:hif1an [Symbiodinium sp. KB8]
MASMFQTLSHPDQLSGGGPCVRHRDNPAPFVKQLLAVDGKTGLTATKPQFCAAHLAHICKVMHDALEAPNSMGIPMDYRLLPGVVPAIVREHFKLPLSDSDEARMLDTSKQYSKARGSRGGGFESDAEKKRQSVPEDVERWSHAYLFDAYHSLASMTKTKVAFLTKEQKDDLQGAMDAIAAKGPPRRRSLLPLTDEADAHHSQQALAAGATFLAAWRSLREDLVNLGKAEAFNATKRAAEAARQSLARRDRRHLATVPPGIDPATWPEGFQNPPPNSPGVAVESTPIGRPPPGYPQSFPLVDMLRDWDADDVWVPKNYGKYASLKTFDFTKDLAEATLYREMEVPFVIRNVPALQAAVKKWSDEGYLKQAFGSKKKMVEHSKDNHHMFYARGRKRHDPNWKPPTGAHARQTPPFCSLPATPAHDIFISFSDWLDKAKKLGAQIRNGEVINNQTDHYYFRVSSAERLPDGKPAKGRHSDLFDNPFIGKDLSMFDRDQPFFIVDGSEQRGIHCRFGMEGVMAECHYDSGRNFVALMRGMKRYILSSPDECPNLDMYMKGPSARHTKGNWGDIDYAKAKLAKASAMEAILQAGDMLYIPSGWFHHIISMTLNYQCNTRSGNPAIWQEEISSCGFRLGSPEKDYEAKHQARLEAAQAEYDATHKAPVHPADKVPANAGQPVGLRGGNA